MKQIVFTFLLATFFVVCAFGDNPETPDLTQIRIKDNPSETLEYVGKIGSGFDNALDSLRRLKSISSVITKVPLEVIFDYDDRSFFGIIYDDCGMYSDVVDTEGYYYLRSWYSNTDNITTPANPAENRVFDLQGRRMTSTSRRNGSRTVSSRGVYIKDGRKAMTR